MNHRNERTTQVINIEYNPDKLKASILFFVSSGDIVDLGKTKLMKLLYYADFDHFEQYGEPITGARYTRMDQGPVPREAFDVLDEMIESGALKFKLEPVGPYQRHCFHPVAEPNLGLFSGPEMDTLHRVTEMWRAHSKNQIVAAAHGEAPWLACDNGDDIAYELAYYRNTYGAMDFDQEEIAAMQEVEVLEF